MRQLLLGLVLLALGAPAVARADVRVSAFYYPWYGTSARDGSYQHWSQHGHTPPDDIASAYYPARGLYSSSRPARRRARRWTRSARGHRRDRRLVVGAAARPRTRGCRRSSRAARADGIAVAAHLEPYARPHRRQHGRRRRVPARRYGIRTFYVYRALDLPVADWAAAHAALHAGGATALRADGARRCRGAARVRRHLHLRHRHLPRRRCSRRLCGEAHARAPALRAVGRAGLRRAPRQRRPASSSRAVTARRTTRCGARRSRARRPRDDHVVQRVARGHADRAGVVDDAGAARYRYLSYDGAWGLHGVRPPRARTSTRTRYWSDVFRKHVAAAAEDQGVVDVPRLDAAQLRVRRGRRPRPATRRARAPPRPSAEPIASSASTARRRACPV